MIRYFVLSVIFITWLVYSSKFYPWSGFPIDKAEWGTFGDFVDGVTNPVLTFFIIAMLIESINSQKEVNGSIIKQNLRMYEVSERQKEMDDSRSFELSLCSLAGVPRREFDAFKIIGRNKKVYSVAGVVVHSGGHLLNACKSKASKELTGQSPKSDTDSSMAIFSTVRSFYILFKFINESYSDNHKKGYYETANYTVPVKFLHLVCLVYISGDWKITSDSKRYGSFKRKGLGEYVFNFTCVKNRY